MLRPTVLQYGEGVGGRTRGEPICVPTEHAAKKAEDKACVAVANPTAGIDHCNVLVGQWNEPSPGSATGPAHGEDSWLPRNRRADPAARTDLARLRTEGAHL
jgi:hypothetical protein